VLFSVAFVKKNGSPAQGFADYRLRRSKALEYD
jgi:hypothetical protein